MNGVVLTALAFERCAAVRWTQRASWRRRQFAVKVLLAAALYGLALILPVR